MKDGDKILDIGAGAGEYSLYFARKGYEVSALELADANIAAFKKKLTPEDKIDLVQGNALDLSRYADKSFDIVLLFGPLYHLKNDADKQKCISEAKRVCKDGGKIFFAFISNDFIFLTEFGYDVNYFSNGDYPELPHRAAQRGRGRRHLDDLPQKRRHAAPAPHGQNHAHPGRDVDGERLSDGNDRRPERAARHARARGGSKVGLHFAAARGDIRGWTDDENFCCDLIGSEGGTTFTGTVTIATRGIHPSNITNVRFVGDGTGIGLSASEGAFLHRCTFENWEIGAYGGLGSWVNATGCTFRGNDVGL